MRLIKKWRRAQALAIINIHDVMLGAVFAGGSSDCSSADRL